MECDDGGQNVSESVRLCLERLQQIRRESLGAEGREECLRLKERVRSCQEKLQSGREDFIDTKTVVDSELRID